MLVGTSQSIVEKKQSQRQKKLVMKKIMMVNTLGLFYSLIHLKIVSYGNIFFIKRLGFSNYWAQWSDRPPKELLLM